MSDYISREAAMEIVKRTSGDYAAAFSEIRKLPAADVEPVRHGKWIIVEDEYFSYAKCPACGDEFTFWDGDCAITNYCPNCGAKMDLEDDNGNQ